MDKLELPEELRAELRVKFSRAPSPVCDHAADCADLVFHAVSEAVATIERVGNSAAPDLRLPVITIGLTTAAHVFKELDTALMGAIVERLFAQRTGAGQ
jgi:hypothetical protein